MVRCSEERRGGARAQQALLAACGTVALTEALNWFIALFASLALEGFASSSSGCRLNLARSAFPLPGHSEVISVVFPSGYWGCGRREVDWVCMAVL